MSNLVITIGRQCGSRGKTIGKKVAEALGVKCYDKELLTEAAKHSGLCEELFETHDEKPTNSFLYSLVMDTYSLGYTTSAYMDMPINHKIFLAQFDTIRRIADEGSCVIVGRCSDYVLRGLPEASHIFIYAEEKDKIKRAVQEYGIPEDEAQKLMRDTDKARANYYAYHTGRKWGEHVNYSLSIDSGYIEIEDIVDLIVQYTKVRRFSQV